MLENLTKKLIEDDIYKNNKNIMFEGAVISSNMSQVERYSLINETTECESIKNILNRISFNDKDTFDVRSERLYEACSNPKIIAEAIELSEKNSVKILSMSKEDYDKIMIYIKEYIKTNDDDVKSQCKQKIKSFVTKINSNITRADEVDAFIASAIRKIYNALRSDRPITGSSKVAVMVNIRGIKDSLN